MDIGFRIGEYIRYSGVFFPLTLIVGLAACVWIYDDSSKYWHSVPRALVLSISCGVLLGILFFINVFYPLAVVIGAGIYIVLGHRLPYATSRCSCGSSNPHLALNCSYCGKSLAKRKDFVRICPACKREYLREECHCLHCGTALIEVPVDQPGPRRNGGILNCPACGEKNIKWRTECWKCKHQFDASETVSN